jgi:pyruvate dehydrogenase E2 component (dihydrolipoamide acetyltransferase)
MATMGKYTEISSIQRFDIQRRVVAHKTTEAWQTVPHVGGQYEPDMTDFLKVFETYKKIRLSNDPNAPKLTLNLVLFKIFAECFKVAPELNAFIQYSPASKTGQLQLCEKINIACPLLLSDGRMITPVFQDVGNKNLEELAAYNADLLRRLENTNIDELLFEISLRETFDDLKHGKLSVLARAIKGLFGKDKVNHLKGGEKDAYYQISPKDRLIPEDILSSTTLVSNIGAAYHKFRGNLTLIDLIAPQVFVIGVSTIQRQVTVYSDEDGNETSGIRSILPMLFTFDHRGLDFGHVIPFLKKFDEIIADPHSFFNTQFQAAFGNPIEKSHQTIELSSNLISSSALN